MLSAWQITMRTHPQVGFDILSKSNAPIFKLAAEVSLCHHEKWDGSGYPAPAGRYLIDALGNRIAFP